MRLTPKGLYRWWREDREKQQAAKAAARKLAQVQERARKAHETEHIPPIGGSSL